MSAAHLLDPTCRTTLDDWSRGTTLFVFDYDGTLAPAAGEPNHGQMSPTTRRQLDALAQDAPVAVISSRTRADLLQRLPQAVQWVLGSHGNDGLPQDAGNAQEHSRLCAGWQARLMADHSLWHDAPGASIDYKGRSLTLRYQEAENPVLARSRLLARAVRLTPTPRIVRGHDAIDLLPPGSLTKADVIAMLLRASGCDRVMVIGSDISDEPMFQFAPEHWMTVRVGTCVHTDARWLLRNMEEVSDLLSHIATTRQMHGLRDRPHPRHALP